MNELIARFKAWRFERAFKKWDAANQTGATSDMINIQAEVMAERSYHMRDILASMGGTIDEKEFEKFQYENTRNTLRREWFRLIRPYIMKG